METKLVSRNVKVVVNIVLAIWCFIASGAQPSLFGYYLGSLLLVNIIFLGLEKVGAVQNKTSRTIVLLFFSFIFGVAVQTLAEQLLGEFDDSIATALVVAALTAVVMLWRQHEEISS